MSRIPIGFISRCLFGLCCLTALAITSVYLLIASYDREAVKQLVQDKVRHATGRELSIDGALDFRILPRPAIVMSDVSLSNADWGSREDMIRVKKFAIEFGIKPMTRGELRVGRFYLVEPDILLETDKTGRGNWEMGETVAGEFNEELAQVLTVDELIIGEGKVVYRDGASGSSETAFFKILTGRIPRPGQLILKGSGLLGELLLEIALDIERGPEVFTLSAIDLTLGTSELTGAGSLSLKGPRPKVTAAFTVPVLDLRGLRLVEDAADRDPNRSVRPFVFTPDPLPMDGLQLLDIDAQIEANRIRLSRKIEVTDARLMMRLEAGNLAIRKLAGEVFGGTVDAGLWLNSVSSPPELKLSITAAGMNYGHAVSPLTTSKDIDGTVFFYVDVTGRGTSMREVAASFDGDVVLVAQNGIIDNGMLMILSSGLIGILSPLFGGSEETALTCAVGEFEIEKGLATARELFLDGPTFVLDGEGTIDFNDESLALSFDPTSREMALVKMEVPFRVEGTLREPTATPKAVGAVRVVSGIVEGVTESIFGSIFGQFSEKRQDRRAVLAQEICADAIQTLDFGAANLAAAP